MKEVKPLHRRLQKQLKRSGLIQHGLPDDLSQWQHFLHQIDLSYNGTSDAQYLLERSLEVSSQEMRKLYDDLKAETEQRIDALHKSEQKTRFMANMSHELRTPSTAFSARWKSSKTRIWMRGKNSSWKRLTRRAKSCWMSSIISSTFPN